MKRSKIRLPSDRLTLPQLITFFVMSIYAVLGVNFFAAEDPDNFQVEVKQ